MPAVPQVRHFHDADTGTLTYVVSDPATAGAAVIDPVLGYDPVSGRTSTAPLAPVEAFIDEQGLDVCWVLETHAHADHLSGAAWLKNRCDAPVAIGTGITAVQSHFAEIYNLGAAFAVDGSQFDRLFADGDTFDVGALTGRVLATPGHTSDGVTYVIGDAAFVGDTLFMPDAGTARCDFPGGDAGRLYDSIQAILALPDDTRLFVCHDYQPDGRELAWQTSVAEQRAANIHVGGATSRDAFIGCREARDATLGLPRLLLPALQVNIRAGLLPAAEDNGTAYLKIPLDRL